MMIRAIKISILQQPNFSESFFQPSNPLHKRKLMFFLRTVGILHFAEQFAGQLLTIAAAFKTFLVYGAVEQRTGLIGHHFFGPESLSAYGITTVTFLPEKFAFVAD